MFEVIEKHFKKYPAQKRVALFLLKKGLKVDKDGRIKINDVEIPFSQIGKVLDVDRRVVEATAKKILEIDELRRVFLNLECVAFLRNVAKELGLHVIEIKATDASKPGIIGKVATLIAKHGISIRQAVADDPYFIEKPKFTVIVDGKIPGKLIEELKAVEGIEEITIL